MKKLLLAITILCTGINYAQQEGNTFLEQGRWGLGGRLSLNATKHEDRAFSSDRETLQINVMPKVGYSIADNWLLGTNFMYGYNEQKTTSSSYSNNDVSYHSIGVAPFIQKYFPVFDSFAISLQASLEYERRWREISSSSIVENFSENAYAAAIRPGFSYFLGKHFALEATTGILSYSILNQEEAEVDTDKAQHLRLDFGLSNIQFGAIYYF